MNRFMTGVPPVHSYYTAGYNPTVSHPHQITSSHQPHTQPHLLSHHQQRHIPQLYLVNQTSLLEEKFSKNGIQKNLHVVVKNTPFTFTLSLGGSSEQVNFHRYQLEATLLYDFDEPKEVDFIRLKPLEYRSQANDAGDICSIEMRIKVLSSQLEDMFFRIRFTAYDSVTRSSYPGLVVYSEPIKVISKPDQIVKKKEPKVAPVSKKALLSDVMSETLARIEEYQREQKEMLSILNSQPRENPTKKRKTNDFERKEREKESQADPLEKEFIKMIKYFEELTKEEKKNKVQNLKKDLAANKEPLQELIDLLLTDNLFNQRARVVPQSLKDTSLPSSSVDAQCLAADECHVLKEQAQIEQFYADFMGTTLF